MRDEDLRKVWQHSEKEHVQMSLDQLQDRAADFQRRARTGDVAEFFGCAMVVLSFASFLWNAPDLPAKLGGVVMILVTLFVAYQLRRHRAARMSAPDGAALPLLEFHRNELVRRRNLLQDSWKLFVGPLVFGLVVFAACLGTQGPSDKLPLWILCGIVVVMGVVISLYNRRQAGNLQRDIDELNSFGSAGANRVR